MTAGRHPRCSCCGQEVAGLPRLDSLVVALGLTGLEKSVFTILSAARGRYLTIAEIAEALYCDREDGGPDWPGRVVSVTIFNLRRKLAHYPAAVEIKPGGNPSVARLVANRWAIERIGRGYQLVKREAA